MNLILFGAAMYARQFACDCLQKGDTILFFVDNDTNKQNTTIALECGGGGADYALLSCPRTQSSSVRLTKSSS